MKDFIVTLLIGWSIGFAGCWFYFWKAKLIRNREEHYFAVHGFSDHCRRAEAHIAIDEAIQENKDRELVVRILQDLQTKI